MQAEIDAKERTIGRHLASQVYVERSAEAAGTGSLDRPSKE